MLTMVTRTVGFNSVFKEANQCRKRYRVLKGSAGSGKSVNIAQDYVIKLMDDRFKGANLLVVRKVEESNRDSTFAELQSAIFNICGDAYESYWNIRTTPLQLTCKTTGNSVIFRGVNDAKQREKVKSITFSNGKLTWIWIEEATELQESDIDILDDRLRGTLENPNLYYQMTLTFNPVSSSHWIKSKYFDVDKPEIYTHSSTYLDNRFIDDAYHKRMMLRKERDPEGYKVYGLGEWGETGGLILTNYTVKAFETGQEYFDSKVYAQDFGYNHANAILDIGFKDGNLYICDEIYVHEMDTNEIIQLADKKGLNKRVVMWCDSAEPDRIKMWKSAGYRAYGVKKEPNSVAAQIDYLKQLHIFIHPHCQNTIKEIQQWKWKLDTKTNKYMDIPVDVYDDAMAALRYSIEDKRRQNKLKTISKSLLGL